VSGQPTRQDDRQLGASRARHVAAVASGAHARAGRAARVGLSKVPEVTVAFWITKVLTTGMGEAASDYLTRAMAPAIAVGLGFVGFAAAIALQFATRRYRTWVYWLAVAMVGVFGTMAADVLHVGLGVPYIASTAFYMVALAVIFGVWYATERSLSIHSIRTPRREFFYWATVLATFALGTAAGDLTATTMHLGYLASGVLFAVAIAVPAVAWRLGLNPILTFWAAYIVTRPLGASFADWMGGPTFRGGLGVPTALVAVLWGLAIVAVAAAALIIDRRRADGVLRPVDRPIATE